MNIVSGSLRRPMTVIVLVIAACLAGFLAIQQMSRDIFPPLGIPTIYVAQPFGGMDPAQMEGYLTYYYEYHFLYITGIEHVESKNIQGASIMKLQFHPGTDMAAAMAETVQYVNRARAFMPPGTVPPFVMRFDAGSVAVGQLVFSTDNPTRTVGQMQDAALNAVVSTIPAVLAGVVLILGLTGTTLNIQSAIGAIMAVGVAVANAILLVTFAERSHFEGKRGVDAAVEGAVSRLRPILMTSCAMTAGMIPMALGLGEGGAQSAPLGRAVIGGLVAATFATLFILPAVFALVRHRSKRHSVSLDPDDPHSAHFTPAPAAAR